MLKRFDPLTVHSEGVFVSGTVASERRTVEAMRGVRSL